MTNVNNPVKDVQQGSKAAATSTNKLLKLFSTNGAGVINGKVTSLQNEVKATRATVVTVQETHCKRKRKN